MRLLFHESARSALLGQMMLAALAAGVGACVPVASAGKDDAGPGRDAVEACTRPPCDDERDVGGADECVPDCSPGYVCIDGDCVQDCNPPCGAGEVCSADRVCQSVEDAGEDSGDAATDALSDAAVDDGVADVAAELVDTGTLGETEQGACVEAEATPRLVRNPVDLVLAVDTSGSMDQEAEGVADRLNDLATQLAAAGTSIRLVLVADNGICIPPPLSGALGCPDVDGAQYLHVRTGVDSKEVFSTVLASWTQIETFLRPSEADLHFLVVTDDNDDDSYSSFESAIAAGDGRDFVFHSLTAANISGGDDGLIPCVGWAGVGAAPGYEYRRLSDRTGGVKASLCESDWDGIFDALGEAIAERSLVPCEYVLPDPGEGLGVDPDRVNVRVVPTGEPSRLIPNLDLLAECGAAGGWVWTDASQTRIELCASVCGENVDSVSIEFGCETVKE